MTAVYITIDTEYSAGLAHGPDPASQRENFAHSIAGETPFGAFGIFHQMDVFDRYGIKAVFFVDPMPALLWGVGAIAEIVEPILARGHDVQLHLHTEWLEFAGQASPLPGRTGRNLADFSFEEQVELIAFARDTLMKAGAAAPVAFRAGNYGADDNTLRALREVGIGCDTSYPPGIPHSACAISLGSEARLPLDHLGTLEVPVGAVRSFGGSLRHAQITALSAWELLAALRYSRARAISEFTIVSHSFELLSRDRRRPNRVLTRRFEKFCRGLARMPGVESRTYAAGLPLIEPVSAAPPALPHSEVRSFLRMAEQMLANTLYGAQ